VNHKRFLAQRQLFVPIINARTPAYANTVLLACLLAGMMWKQQQNQGARAPQQRSSHQQQQPPQMAAAAQQQTQLTAALARQCLARRSCLVLWQLAGRIRTKMRPHATSTLTFSCKRLQRGLSCLARALQQSK
jgi:hypothetical protein